MKKVEKIPAFIGTANPLAGTVNDLVEAVEELQDIVTRTGVDKWKGYTTNSFYGLSSDKRYTIADLREKSTYYHGGRGDSYGKVEAVIAFLDYLEEQEEEK